MLLAKGVSVFDTLAVMSRCFGLAWFRPPTHHGSVAVIGGAQNSTINDRMHVLEQRNIRKSDYLVKSMTDRIRAVHIGQGVRLKLYRTRTNALTSMAQLGICSSAPH
jgi:hypothetical protein